MENKMDQFDNSEVMMKYAEIMLQKKAWTWRDVLTDVGIDLGITGGLALLGFSVGGPLGILASIPVTIALSYVFRQLDDNIPDLIDRLEDLDPKPGAERMLQGWIDTLKQFQQKTQDPQTFADPEKRAQASAAFYAGMKELEAFLKQLKQTWQAGAKDRFSDMVFDIGQAEHAINETLAATTQGLERSKKALQGAASEVLKEQAGKTGTQYIQLAKEIEVLYNDLTRLGGKAPSFDTGDEKAAWNAVQRILGKTESLQPLSKHELSLAGPLMKKLKTLMEQGVEHFKKESTSKPILSKRALTLGDGTKIFDSEAYKSKPGKGPMRKTRTRVDPVVQKLQQLVNELNSRFNPGWTLGRIQEDGIYGPNTAAAIESLLLKFKVLRDVAGRFGVDINHLKNYSNMRRDTRNINVLYKIMEATYKGSTGTKQETTQQNIPGGRCRPDKHDPTSDEIISCLKNYFKVRDPQTGEWYYAYYWLNSLGIYSEDRMVVMIQDSFPPARYRPMDWDPARFVSYVMNRMGGRQGTGKIF